MEVTITLLGARLRSRHERSNLVSNFIADLPCAANQYHKRHAIPLNSLLSLFSGAFDGTDLHANCGAPRQRESSVEEGARKVLD